MKRYALSPQALGAVRGLYLRRMTLFALLLLPVVAAMSWFAWGRDQPWTTTLAGVLVMVALLAFAIYRAWPQQRQIWESVRLELGDDYIARSQLRVPELRIRREEITAVEDQGSGLCIRTADKYRTLLVPGQLDADDYAEIKATLAGWAPIQPVSTGARARNIVLAVALAIGLGIVLFAWSLWLVLIAAGTLVAFYGYYFWQLQRTQGVDPQFRRQLAGLLLFMLVVTAGKICMLSGAWVSILEVLARGGR